MGKASPIQTSFNAGELSPRMAGRVDLAKYANGARLIENFLLAMQGPAIRRAGTRYVGAVKDSSRRSWLLRFEFNTTQAYVLEFGHLYIRFYANHGQVLSGSQGAYNAGVAYQYASLVSYLGDTYYCLVPNTGVLPTNVDYWYKQTNNVYEIPTPYREQDLIDTDGTLRLRFAQSGDIIFIAHPLYQPRKLTRFGPVSWTLTTLANNGGPFKTIGADPSSLVWAGGVAGNVWLLSNQPIFQPGHVGALFYLGEADVRNTPQWEPGKSYGAGQTVRSNGINYYAMNSATSGGVKPVHTSGASFDGTGGVQWLYLEPGYGWGRILDYISPTQVLFGVISRLPDGALNPSMRWAMGAWNNVDGYPSQVTFFRERLVFAGGQRIWTSVTGDYENFNPRDETGQVAADGAIAITVVARKVNQIQWLDPGVDLLIGTAGGEFRCGEMTKNQVFGPDNITVQPQSEYGSRALAPQRIGSSILYVQRSGRKVREMAYDFGPDSYKSTDISVLSEHITESGLIACDYQQEPHAVLWYARADGVLVGLTFNREQDVIGWHRHNIGGGAVEAVTCIPSPDGSRNELWMIVRRTINGQTKRYVEYMEAEMLDGGDLEQAFYLDSGLSFDGKVNATLTPGAGATQAHGDDLVPFDAGAAVFSAGDIGRYIHYRYRDTLVDSGGRSTRVWKSAKARIVTYVSPTSVFCAVESAFPSAAMLPANAWRMSVTRVTGLDHLEGMTVDVLTNGASHPQRVVLGGAIDLQAPASVVHAGLPCPARLWTMRLNAGGMDGTSQGKTARVNKLAIRFHETLGAQYGPDSDHLDELPFRSTGDAMDAPPPLYTGDKIVEFDADYSLEPCVYVQNNQPLPCTVIAVMPQTHVYDR